MHIKNLKVSSVLNNDKKLFGKHNLIDENDDTCWNSAGNPLYHTQLEMEKNDLSLNSANTNTITDSSGMRTSDTRTNDTSIGNKNTNDTRGTVNSNMGTEFIILKTGEKFVLDTCEAADVLLHLSDSEGTSQNKTSYPYHDPNEHLYLDLQFQGGFTPNRIDVYVQSIKENGVVGKKCDRLFVSIFKVEDINSCQRFNLTKLRIEAAKKQYSLSEQRASSLEESFNNLTLQSQTHLQEEKDCTSCFDKLKLVFVGSSDFYGRFTVYHLRVLKGREIKS